MREKTRATLENSPPPKRDKLFAEWHKPLSSKGVRRRPKSRPSDGWPPTLCPAGPSQEVLERSGENRRQDCEPQRAFRAQPSKARLLARDGDNPPMKKSQHTS